jgi:hypothetical protein
MKQRRLQPSRLELASRLRRCAATSYPKPALNFNRRASASFAGQISPKHLLFRTAADTASTVATHACPFREPNQ